MGGRSFPVECHHGTIIDWGDFGGPPEPPEGSSEDEIAAWMAEQYPTCAQCEAEGVSTSPPTPVAADEVAGEPEPDVPAGSDRLTINLDIDLAELARDPGVFIDAHADQAAAYIRSMLMAKHRELNGEEQ